jgi:hypothetical protein
VVVVQRMLVHSTPAVTLIVYGHLFADDLDTLAHRLQDAKIKPGADRVRTEAPVNMLPGAAAGGGQRG